MSAPPIASSRLNHHPRANDAVVDDGNRSDQKSQLDRFKRIVTSNNSSSNQRTTGLTESSSSASGLSEPSSTASDLSSAKIKLASIAAKLITGVHQTSLETARDRWSPSTSNQIIKPPSHRPKQQSDTNHRSVTASAFAAAKQERVALRLPQQNQQSPNQPYPINYNSNPYRPQALPSSFTSQNCSHQSPPSQPNSPSYHHHHHYRSQSQFERNSAGEALVAEYHKNSPMRAQKKGSAPAAIVDHLKDEEESNENPSDLKTHLQESDRQHNRLKENEPPQNLPKKMVLAGSRFVKNKLNSNESFIALPYSNTSPIPNNITSSKSSDHIDEARHQAPSQSNRERFLNGPQRLRTDSSHLPEPSLTTEHQKVRQIANSRKIENPMRDLYLSKVGDKDGRIENEKQSVDREFEKLLNAMQVADSVKVKMNGLDHPVKSAMLKSSNQKALLLNMIGQAPISIPTSTRNPNPLSILPKSKSVDLLNQSQLLSSNKNTGNEFLKESPAWWVMYLKSHNFRELLATDLKRLRVALRTQTPFWTQEFIGFGGYLALLKRLKELLEIEWREEQHDDQVLFEILRCFKALLLTEPGREALSSKLPDPFVQLTSLLYSEKKPGDLSSRQVIIELILGIFELNYDPRVISQIDWKALIDLNKADTKSFSNPQDNSPAPLLSSSTNLSRPERVAGSYDDGGDDGLLNLRLIRHEFVKKLLVGPPDLKKEQMVEFVVKTHRNRIFKSLVNELIGVLMDYFWVFCHSENKFLDLSDIDEEKFEAPKVPSGMTGGVEYEAMSYCTVLMKLINEMIKSSEDEDEALKIHSDLFESGFEKCLITMRKSSLTYYPTVHLEISRYLNLGTKVLFKFPYSINKYMVSNGGANSHERGDGDYLSSSSGGSYKSP